VTAPEETLAAIRPYSPWRASVKELSLFLARALPRITERETMPVHMTASAFVVDPAGDRVLLVRHPKFGRWLQPGGHCDGDTDLAAVAQRETVEETGIEDLTFDPIPFDVDVHPGEPTDHPHMHVDVRFVAAAPPGSSKGVPSSPEGLELGWFAPDELPEFLAEPARAAIRRAR
jgi:8-oxo-dGTP pyrophosphatase MutT (NUDIX family)